MNPQWICHFKEQDNRCHNQNFKLAKREHIHLLDKSSISIAHLEKKNKVKVR